MERPVIASARLLQLYTPAWPYAGHTKAHALLPHTPYTPHASDNLKTKSAAILPPSIICVQRVLCGKKERRSLQCVSPAVVVMATM